MLKPEPNSKPEIIEKEEHDVMQQWKIVFKSIMTSLFIIYKRKWKWFSVWNSIIEFVLEKQVDLNLSHKKEISTWNRLEPSKITFNSEDKRERKEKNTYLIRWQEIICHLIICYQMIRWQMMPRNHLPSTRHFKIFLKCLVSETAS